MAEIVLTSKDLARVLYLMDNALTEKADFRKWKERYETLIKNMKLSGLKIDKEYTESHEIDMEKDDEKLRWKIQLIQESVHQAEIEETEEEEEDDD